MVIMMAILMAIMIVIMIAIMMAILMVKVFYQKDLNKLIGDNYIKDFLILSKIVLS